MTGGVRCALALSAILAAGCFDSMRSIPVSHPLVEALLSSDGTEVVTWLAKGVKTGDIVDLTVFGEFRAGMTPTEAQNRFGPPTRVTQDDSGTSFIYERHGRTIQIVQYEGLSSVDDSKVVWYSLQARVPDPPFSAGLPESLRRLLKVDDRLRTVRIGPLEPLQPAIALNLTNGRVHSVSIAPDAPDNNEMQRTKPAQATQLRR